ncbi:MAG: ytxJ [Mucilaginibacter sp.]|nr:ytxJ [Mucilaginibacter sp.]
MELDSLPENLPLYFLDLIKYRDISNQIAQDFQVHHQSPQLLLIKDGQCILDQSHSGISLEEALAQLN